MSIVEKVAQSDMVIWLDQVQYSHGGWTNRNRMPNRSWLTVPVVRDTDMAPINRVRISESRGWRDKHVKTLCQNYGEDVADLVAEITRPYRLLVGLNLACLRVIMSHASVFTPWVFQSHLDSGSSVSVVSEHAVVLEPISRRLAMMVEELGGSVYLSGPSGRKYLDESPFKERGIEVRYFKYDGDNDCSVKLL